MGFQEYPVYFKNPGKATGNQIPTWPIRKIYKRTRPVLQAQPCIPAKYGDKGGKGPGFALTGPRNSQLMLTLDQDGYRTK